MDEEFFDMTFSRRLSDETMNAVARPETLQNPSSVPHRRACSLTLASRSWSNCDSRPGCISSQKIATLGLGFPKRRTVSDDLSDAIAVSESCCAIAEIHADVPAAFPSQGARAFPFRREFQHMFDSVIDVGIGPHLALGKWVSALWDLTQLVTNQT